MKTVRGYILPRRCCVNPLDEGWNELTSLDQLNAETLSGIAAYAAAKTLSERAVWDLAEKHKDVDFTTSQSPFRPPQIIPCSNAFLAQSSLLASTEEPSGRSPAPVTSRGLWLWHSSAIC